MLIPDLVVGVDPGINGGFGFLFKDGSMRAFRTPNDTSVVGKTKGGNPKKKTRIVLPELRKIFREIKDYERSGKIVLLVMEAINAAPKFGAYSACELGRTAGYLEMAAVMLKLPYVFVESQKWRPQMVGVKKDKTHSLRVARRLWPTLELENKDDGVAEAFLMARWYLENQLGATPLCHSKTPRKTSKKKSSKRSAKK